mgnify:CR=1 FL=1
MLGLGTSVTSIDSGQIYKELSELGSYASLTLHFDFSTLSGISGSEVTAATNLGAGGSAFNIGTNSETPLLDRNGFGGRSSVIFDGSDEFLVMGREFTSTNKSFTFFVVLQRHDLSNDYAVAGSGEEEITDSIRFTGTGESIQTIMASQTAVTTTLSSTSGSTVDYTQVAQVPSVLVMRRNTSGEMYIYADNGIYIGAKTNTAIKAAVRFSLLTIGGTGAEGAADFTGQIGEVGMYDADIGDAAAITLSKELSTKWGVNRRS